MAEVITRTHREEWARIVAGLARKLGDLDIAEDMAAEAFAEAATRWPVEGVPPRPGAWLTTTARRKAIDRLRREAHRHQKHLDAQLVNAASDPEPVGAVGDDRLRLLFTCCHPALSQDAQVALTLRAVGGLTVAEIAQAFLVQETTMGQRISRAKAKIRAAHIPFRVPAAADLPARIDGVLAVLYLIFNEGYFASGDSTDPIRRELTSEAIRLTRLARELLPDDTEVAGLLALMLLTEARTPARLSVEGRLVRLDEQNRDTWDQSLITEGLSICQAAFDTHTAEGRSAGRYLLIAAINAVHVRARRAECTDWSEIADLYSRLEIIDPGPIVALSKAIAIAERDTPEAGLLLVDRLESALAGHHAFHVARAELLRAAGRVSEALDAYDRAIPLAANTAEVAHLRTRRAQLTHPPHRLRAGESKEQRR